MRWISCKTWKKLKRIENRIRIFAKEGWEWKWKCNCIEQNSRGNRERRGCSVVERGKLKWWNMQRKLQSESEIHSSHSSRFPFPIQSKLVQQIRRFTHVVESVPLIFPFSSLPFLALLCSILLLRLGLELCNVIFPIRQSESQSSSSVFFVSLVRKCALPFLCIPCLLRRREG